MTKLWKIVSLVVAMVSLAPLQSWAAELIMINHPACPYCVQFNSEVLPGYANTGAGKQAPLRQVTLSAKWPADLAGIRPVYFTPVFILVEDGREVGRFAGYFEKEFFWGQLDQLLAKSG